MSRRADPAAAAAATGSAARDYGRARSIALPIFALVLVSVVVAAAVIFAVTFNGPPPRLPVRDADVVARILRTGSVPDSPEGPPLRFSTADAAPAERPQFRRDDSAARALAAALGTPRADVVAFTMRPPEDEGGSAFGRDFILGWHAPGGGWRIVETPQPLLAPWHLQTLIAMLAAVVALAIPAWALARAISRPLGEVARAAERARATAPLDPLPTGGSREVRALAGAVERMHARLASHAEERTTMLAAIAHDLGTPLSRLAFRAELLPEADRERAAADIAEMRAMIAGALAFAREEGGAQDATRIDLGTLVDSLVEDMAEAGAPVALAADESGAGESGAGGRAIVRGDQGALRRLFANLIDNAVRYGERTRIGWRVERDSIAVWIEDDGPGVDPARIERLFEPFVRGDPSRNRATGGTGLGLAIARSIAVRHGGTVTLANAPAGGARAMVTLPLA